MLDQERKLRPANGLEGVQWLSGRVPDSRTMGRGFEPHQPHCVVVLEQDRVWSEFGVWSAHAPVNGIKISKFALPGVMLMYERTSKDRKKDTVILAKYWFNQGRPIPV